MQMRTGPPTWQKYKTVANKTGNFWKKMLRYNSPERFSRKLSVFEIIHRFHISLFKTCRRIKSSQEPSRYLLTYSVQLCKMFTREACVTFVKSSWSVSIKISYLQKTCSPNPFSVSSVWWRKKSMGFYTWFKTNFKKSANLTL